MHEQKQFLPGEGLLVLEVQERVLRFLVDCCHHMLHDIPLAQLLSDKYPPQPVPEIKAASVELDTQAAMAEEEPYRLPAQLDLDSMLSLLQAQADQAADHVWLLRDDPSYFADEILDIQEHRQEMMKDITGAPHPVLSKARRDVFWGRLIFILVVEAYDDAETFAELANQVRETKRLYDKYAPFAPHDDLPDDLLKAILVLRWHLEEHAGKLRGHLAHAFPASPPMRKFWTRMPPANPPTTIMELRLHSKGMTPDEMYISDLCTTLRDQEQLPLFRLPLLMDELDRQLQVHGSLLSSRVGNLIGRLSVLAASQRQLDMFFPWARTYEDKTAGEMGDAVEARYQVWHAPLRWLHELLQFGGTKLVRHTDNLKTRFNYPAQKARTKANVDAMRAAEAHLDAFWAATDEFVATKGGGLRVVSSIRERELQRTPPWAEPIAAPKAKAARKQPVEHSMDALLAPSAPQPVAPRRTKAKTRGTADAELALAIPSPAEAFDDMDDEVAQTISVDSRSLKVFRSLFFTPDTSSQPGEIPWRDFVRAMMAAGFSAQKLRGSIWEFHSESASILFHEPHPHPKLPYTSARRIGRRLFRAYGWRSETFVLRGQSEASA
jgi:hypothetical protein